MTGPLSNSLTALRFGAHVLRYAARGSWLFASSRLRPLDRSVPNDFFGICVASSPDPACDDYVIARLHELGIRHVRLDFTYSDRDGYTQRFLDRLIDDGARVCLHLVQPHEEARKMHLGGPQQRWREFLGHVLDAYGDGIELVEIGSTCNRRKWTGYTMSALVTAWQIAHDEARRRGITLAGPNVTDFEPVYNAGLLGMMRADGNRPDIHSTNLFAERATQPEAFDHKIMGRRLAPLGKFNLVKKARILRQISEAHGVTSTMSMHVAWSKRRIERRLTNSREKQADYLARYLCLAAASGSLDRAYWGPLIGQREGLIDDGTREYPDLPHVWYYGRANGDVPAYGILPAFNALRTVVSVISGAVFAATRARGNDLFILEFVTETHRVHVVWTTNGRAAVATGCYDQRDLGSAQVFHRDGEEMAAPPCLFTETPVYLRWPVGDAAVNVRRGARAMPRVRVPHPSVAECRPVSAPGWRGLSVCLADQGESGPAELVPGNLQPGGGSTMLRRGRNNVWRMTFAGKEVVVKQFRIRAWHRRILDRHKPSRARRAWHGAVELQRRGIGTPRPLAFFENPEAPSLQNSIFVCEACEGPGSVRTAFTAFADGDTSFAGVPDKKFYARLAQFACTMHDRGVYFRDFSPGNILVRTGDGGACGFALIDTTRLRTYEREVPFRQRLADLKRTCHPLHWKGREAFLRAYMRYAGISYGAWMKWPLALYDLKHVLKRLRPRRP